MRIGLVGGILDPSNDRTAVQATTETVLAELLPEHGVDVVELSPRDLRGGLRALAGKVDVLHLHHPGRLTTVAALLPTKVPVVYTPHRMFMPESRILALGHTRLIRRADAVISLSDTEFAEHLRHNPRAALIPNGFPLPGFEYVPRPSPAEVGALRILYVGQLIDLKRVSLLVEAVGLLVRAGQPVDLRLVFHKNDLEDQLRAQVAHLGLEESVTFVGRLAGAALAAEYGRAHTLALPSRTEALPSVITEAVFRGAWVVASDVGGIRWQLGDWGEAIPELGAASLAEALQRCVDSWPTIADSAPAASAAFRERFSAEEMARAHVDLYRSLVRG